MASLNTVPTVITTVRVQEMLDQNFEYIKMIADCQKRGRTNEAAQYSSKLHQNLNTMARVADSEIPADINQVLEKTAKAASKPGQPSPACPARLVPIGQPPSVTSAPQPIQQRPVRPAANLQAQNLSQSSIVRPAAPLTVAGGSIPTTRPVVSPAVSGQPNRPRPLGIQHRPAPGSAPAVALRPAQPLTAHPRPLVTGVANKPPVGQTFATATPAGARPLVQITQPASVQPAPHVEARPAASVTPQSALPVQTTHATTVVQPQVVASQAPAVQQAHPQIQPAVAAVATTASAPQPTATAQSSAPQVAQRAISLTPVTQNKSIDLTQPAATPGTSFVSSADHQ